MNYSELLNNIRDFTDVSADVLSNNIINVFITNTENKIQKELDLDAFRKFATSSLTIGSPFLTVPEDFDFERGIQIVDSNADRAWFARHLDSVRRYLNADEMSYLDEIKKLAERKSLVDEHFARQDVMKKWLLVHLPVSILVLAMSVWHIILVYAYAI